MNSLKELVEKNGGPNIVRFIIDVQALDYTPVAFGMPFCFKGSNSPSSSVTFKICSDDDLGDSCPRDLYGLDSNYKIKLVPDNKGDMIKYGSETFYQSDLMAMIKRSTIKIAKVGQ